ncbi:MAG TPA: hypothetical protein VM847_18830 [Tahibacter sp.]|nr:hypothetical protein [Tahibacter sp.]
MVAETPVKLPVGVLSNGVAVRTNVAAPSVMVPWAKAEPAQASASRPSAERAKNMIDSP